MKIGSLFCIFYGYLKKNHISNQFIGILTIFAKKSKPAKVL